MKYLFILGRQKAKAGSIKCQVTPSPDSANDGGGCWGQAFRQVWKPFVNEQP